MNKLTRKLLITSVVLAAPWSLSAQSYLLSENFEGTTGSALPDDWGHKPDYQGWGAYGVSVANPTGLSDSGNITPRVLGFTNGTSFGDTVSAAMDLTPYFDGDGQPTATFQLSFNFYTPAIGNHQGLVGLSTANLPGSDIIWIAGSASSTSGLGHNSTDIFEGTGFWNTISFDVTGVLTTIANNSSADLSQVQVNLEHWQNGGGNAGTYGEVYFDDVRLEVIPEPSTYAMIGGMLALGCAMVYRRRRNA